MQQGSIARVRVKRRSARVFRQAWRILRCDGTASRSSDPDADWISTARRAVLGPQPWVSTHSVHTDAIVLAGIWSLVAQAQSSSSCVFGSRITRRDAVA